MHDIREFFVCFNALNKSMIEAIESAKYPCGFGQGDTDGDLPNDEVDTVENCLYEIMFAEPFHYLSDEDQNRLAVYRMLELS